MRLAVARDVLDHYADRGDVQLCVTLSRALGPAVEALVPRRRLQSWLLGYIDLLHRLRLWSPASTVMARCSDEGIRGLNQMYTALAPACARCGADAQPVVPAGIVRGAAAAVAGGGAFPAPEQEQWRAAAAAAAGKKAAAVGVPVAAPVAVAAVGAPFSPGAFALDASGVGGGGSMCGGGSDLGGGSDSAAGGSDLSEGATGGPPLGGGGAASHAAAWGRGHPLPAPTLYAASAGAVEPVRVGVVDLRDPTRLQQALPEPVPLGPDGLPPFLRAVLVPGDTVLQPAAPHACGDCRAPAGTCAVCLQPARGMYAWCQGCGHGGHLEHMLEWFATGSSLCPAGCMHVCDLQPLPA